MAEENLSREERDFLLKVAKDSIARKLGVTETSHTKEEAEGVGPRINQDRGCFVTLHKRGQLRGCIGIFEARGPLWQNVEEMAAQAAFNDPRFRPLSRGEFDEIDIEISALTPLRQVNSVDEVKVGEHGIYITRGLNRGVLLPQVATEQGWDRDTFLDHTCMKAGLSAGCWRRPDTTIEIFSAEIFGEKENSGSEKSESI